jgi:hypothetical protein
VQVPDDEHGAGRSRGVRTVRSVEAGSARIELTVTRVAGDKVLVQARAVIRTGLRCLR